MVLDRRAFLAGMVATLRSSGRAARAAERRVRASFVPTLISVSILFAFAALVFGFEPLAKPLVPLPEQEYSRVFNAFSAEGKVPIKLLHQGLFAGQMTVRAHSALLLGDQGDRSSVPYLIDALSDQSMHVGANYPEAGMATTRYWANESLKNLTKQSFGFIWNDPEAKRSKAIQRWREWYLLDSKPKP